MKYKTQYTDINNIDKHKKTQILNKGKENN